MLQEVRSPPWTSDIDLELPPSKRTKLVHPKPAYPQLAPSSHASSSTIIHSNGTITPIQSDSTPMDIDECPCGFLHGPGQGHHEDVTASFGSAVCLLRGPD